MTYFSANGPYQIRKIILQFDTISEQAKSVIRSIWDFLDEITETDAQDLLQRAADSDRKLSNNKNNKYAKMFFHIQLTCLFKLLNFQRQHSHNNPTAT